MLLLSCLQSHVCGLLEQLKGSASQNLEEAAVKDAFDLAEVSNWDVCVGAA